MRSTLVMTGIIDEAFRRCARDSGNLAENVNAAVLRILKNEKFGQVMCEESRMTHGNAPHAIENAMRRNSLTDDLERALSSEEFGHLDLAVNLLRNIAIEQISES